MSRLRRAARLSPLGSRPPAGGLRHERRAGRRASRRRSARICRRGVRLGPRRGGGPAASRAGRPGAVAAARDADDGGGAPGSGARAARPRAAVAGDRRRGDGRESTRRWCATSVSASPARRPSAWWSWRRRAARLAEPRRIPWRWRSPCRGRRRRRRCPGRWRPSPMSRRRRRCSICWRCRSPACCSSARWAGSRSPCWCRRRASSLRCRSICSPRPFSWLPGLADRPVALPSAAAVLGPRAGAGDRGPDRRREPARGTRALLLALLLTALPPGRVAASPRSSGWWPMSDRGTAVCCAEADRDADRRRRQQRARGGGRTSRRRSGCRCSRRGESPGCDAVVVTHGDGDHCGGLVDVASYVPIGEVWATPGAARQPPACASCSRSRGRPSAGSAAGDRLTLGGFDLRGPRAARDRRPARRTTARWSSRWRPKGGGSCSPAISSAEASSSCSPARRALRCDLLKVAHHGSATSSGERFLAAAGRACVGASRAASATASDIRPPEVVARLERAGVRDSAHRPRRRGRRALAARHRRCALDFPGSPRAVPPLASE